MDPDYKKKNKQELLSIISKMLSEKQELAVREEEPPKKNIEEIIEDLPEAN